MTHANHCYIVENAGFAIIEKRARWEADDAYTNFSGPQPSPLMNLMKLSKVSSLTRHINHVSEASKRLTAT